MERSVLACSLVNEKVEAAVKTRDGVTSNGREGVYGIIDHFSIYYLLKSRAIVNGEVNLWLSNGLLALIAAAGIGGGILVFSRKDLP